MDGGVRSSRLKGASNKQMRTLVIITLNSYCRLRRQVILFRKTLCESGRCIDALKKRRRALKKRGSALEKGEGS